MWECTANQIRGWLHSTCYANVPCQLQKPRSQSKWSPQRTRARAYWWWAALAPHTEGSCDGGGGGGEVEQPLNSSRAGAGAGAAGSGSQGMSGICTMHVRSTT